jgi:CPA1 family monovalent cation:H+ antiporter
LKLAQIVALTLAGVAYGYFEPGKLTYAFGALTLNALLPALLFEGAWNLDYRALKRMWLPIVVLAVPGVALTAILIAGALAVVRVPFGPALLTGAILSATDPIAVVAVFRRIPVPHALRTIVEAESLFNDAIAVVLYRAVLFVVLSGTVSGADVATVSAFALLGSVAGIAIGVAIAFLAATLLRNRRNAGLQIATTVICAYGSFFIADHAHASGIFSVISCGIAMRYFERRWVSWELAADVNGFWDVAAVVANVVVFFLLGAALNITVIGRNAAFVIAALVGVTLARGAISVLVVPAGFPSEWIDVIRIAGLRGALSLALAIALPPNTPYRDAIIAAAFAVAIATIVSSTFTVPAVVTRAARRSRA